MRKILAELTRNGMARKNRLVRSATREGICEPVGRREDRFAG
jgi:hypothetical protein